MYSAVFRSTHQPQVATATARGRKRVEKNHPDQSGLCSKIFCVRMAIVDICPTRRAELVQKQKLFGDPVVGLATGRKKHLAGATRSLNTPMGTRPLDLWVERFFARFASVQCPRQTAGFASRESVATLSEFSKHTELVDSGHRLEMERLQTLAGDEVQRQNDVVNATKASCEEQVMRLQQQFEEVRKLSTFQNLSCQ